MRHLLSLSAIEQNDFEQLIDRSTAFAQDKVPASLPLAGRCVGIEFRKTSTRTRTSFAAATVRLGGCPVIFGPADLQTNTGETVEDTVSVLAGYLEVLVIRTAADPLELQRMAAGDELPIVNAMSADEHPTQALSDFAMLKRHFGVLPTVRLLYSGEGNNTAVALAYAACRVPGMHADFRTPQGYGFTTEVLTRAEALSRRYGGRIRHSHAPPRADDVRSADVIYTTRWQTTGTSKADPQWRRAFSPYRLTGELCAGCRDSSVFMHDLPAVRGEECDAEFLEGPRSICFEQARQKLFTAMAVIDWCIEGRRSSPA